MVKIANILGKEDDALELQTIYEKIVNAYQEKFIIGGKLIETSQTAALLTLEFKLCPKELEQRILRQLLENIKNNNYRLSTGFLGTPFLLPVLFRYGQTEMAEKLLFQREFPSWLYPVLQGATSIWERWDGYTLENGILGQPMNSFNHYAYGSVASCFYANLGGIKQDLSATGFRKVIIQPYFSKKLDFVEASYLSPYDMIRTKWQRENQQVTFNVEIPANVIATLLVPGMDEKVVGSGKYTFTVND
jgi:alpha-L-rhamnosidase